MKSPAAEWTLGIAYLGTLDYLRARGEADGDTVSEVLRDLIHRTPGGEIMFKLALAGSAWWFHQHILSPLADMIDPDER